MAQTISSADYWTKYLSTANPCQFPQLEGKATEKDDRRTLRINVNLDDLLGLQKNSTKDGASFLESLQVAWGAILGRYTVAEEVCFGFVEAGKGVVKIDAPAAGLTSIKLLALKMSLKEGNSVDDALAEMRRDYALGLPHSFMMGTKGPATGPMWQAFNTAIFYYRDVKHTYKYFALESAMEVS